MIRSGSMDEELQRRLAAALERPHRLGMIGGDIADHLEHSANFAALFDEIVSAQARDEGSTGAIHAGDLGTGGGIPGVVLAAMWPQWRWTLIDVRTSRAQEVATVVARLGLEQTCQVVGQAAQELGRGEPWRASFDILVARAFGPPALLAECAAGLLVVGGSLLVSEPPQADVTERWPTDSLAHFGLGPVRLRDAGGSRFAIITKVEATPDRFPRTPPRSDRGWPSAR